MPDEASAAGAAFDGSVVAGSGESGDPIRLAQGAVEGYENQLAEAHEALNRAEAKRTKVQELATAAEAGVEHVQAAIGQLETHLAAARAHLAELGG